MEAYGVARAASSAIVSQKFVIAKGVQDFADAQKGDEFRDYAAFVSAAWLHHFVSSYWNLLRS
jgi:nucleoside phosphorylase